MTSHQYSVCLIWLSASLSLSTMEIEHKYYARIVKVIHDHEDKVVLAKLFQPPGFSTKGRHFITSFLVAVLMNADFSMEDGLTNADNFSALSQPPLPACSNSNKSPDDPGLITSATSFCEYIFTPPKLHSPFLC